jgi:rhodanese-related sulfurtransferase
MELERLAGGAGASFGSSPGAAAAPVQIVDVRSPREFACGHLPGAMHIPLGQILPRSGELNREATVVLICRSGMRARLAAQRLEAAGFRDLAVLSGGMAGGHASGSRPLTHSAARSWSLERQVRLGAGVLVLGSLALAWLASWWWLLLTAFVGAGLTFAGATDLCALGLLLARMPWNRAAPAGCGVISPAGSPPARQVDSSRAGV